MTLSRHSPNKFYDSAKKKTERMLSIANSKDAKALQNEGA
jgi:hypothetical protein